MKKKITRRQFVQATAAATATVAIAPTLGCSGLSSPYDSKGLPTVKLGNTGAQVPVMGFGCGSRWMSVADDDKALEILEFALDLGLYYWDTASSYGNDQISSEERIGKILKAHREKVFLVSKTGDRGADKAKESITLTSFMCIPLSPLKMLNSLEKRERYWKFWSNIKVKVCSNTLDSPAIPQRKE